MDLYDAFRLGLVLGYIRNVQTIEPYVKGEQFLLWGAKELYDCVKENNLDKTIETELSKWIKKLENYKEDKLSDADALELSSDARDWVSVLSRCLIERRVLELTRTGGLNQKALLDTTTENPSAFFNEKTWNAMSEIEKSDFSDSAKCLLASIPTPAAMIALRGAEATVKRFFEFKTGNSAKKKLWGPMVTELKKRAKDLKIKDTFLGYLDYIRDAKRNFTAHPNKTYDQQEAELIFMEAVNLVQDTYKEILKKQKS